MDFIKLQDEPLSPGKLISLVTDPSCGAISTFVGTTRNSFEDKEVVRLEYEAYHGMAEKEIKKICNQMRSQFNVKNVAVVHRLGEVPVSEASIVIAVSSEHRREAIDAVSYLIDELKSKVPIWKKEIYDNGDSSWKQNREFESFLANNRSEKTTDKDTDQSELPNKKTKTENDNSPFDEDMVQIVASRSEIERRIDAFCQYKRNEINDTNIQEFCVLVEDTQEGPDLESSCARTKAVVRRSKDSNSHLRLTHVINDWGPQSGHTQHSPSKSCASKHNSGKIEVPTVVSSGCSADTHDELPVGIRERVKNMETFLAPDSPVPKDIYSRLKNLEDRLLFLESHSPEYFPEKCSEMLRSYGAKYEDAKWTSDPGGGGGGSDITVEDINRRMFELKKKLKSKQIEASL